MTYRGHIENGLVVFDETVALPEGTPVRVQPVAEGADVTCRTIQGRDRLHFGLAGGHGRKSRSLYSWDKETMTCVFADTFYFLAILNVKDAAHDKAVALSQSLEVPVLTTAWVRTELADGLADSSRRHMFRNVVDDLQADPETIVVPPSQKLFEQGMDLYNARSDKEWSLTDCISFIVMERYGVQEALTGDRHFEQAGFRALLV